MLWQAFITYLFWYPQKSKAAIGVIANEFLIVSPGVHPHKLNGIFTAKINCPIHNIFYTIISPERQGG